MDGRGRPRQELAVESNAGDPHGCGEVEQCTEQLPGAIAEGWGEGGSFVTSALLTNKAPLQLHPIHVSRSYSRR